MTEVNIAALKEDYDKVKNENFLLKNEISKIKKENKQIKLNKDNFEDKIRKYMQKNQKKLEKTQKLNAQYTKNIQTLYSKCKSQLDNNKRLIEIINCHDNQNKEEINKLISAFKNILISISPLKNEIKQLFDEIIEKENENQFKSIIIERLKEKIINSSNYKVESLQNELQLKEKETQNQASKIAKLKKTIEQLNQKIENAQTQFNYQIEEILSQLKSKEQENKELLLQINEANSIEKMPNFNIDDFLATMKNVEEIENEVDNIATESERYEQENAIKDVLIEQLKSRIIELNLQLRNQSQL